MWRTGWTALHDIQERSIPVLHNGNEDVIIAAPTAGGKTEAAFLPLISRTIEADDDRRGFDLLYVSPLRALINDQFRRLSDLCETVEVPVHPWHSDISSAIKTHARRNPRGILLITPESLEATFVLRGPEIPELFGNLACIIIDELHAFIDTERGIQVRSLLSRIEYATQRRIRRAGLSATLGDMALARQYVRPDAPEAVQVVKDASDGPALRLQIRGYRQTRGDSQSDDDEQHHNWLARRPRYHVHFTPTSSSWINQVERWFAEITQQRIRRGSFPSTQALERAIREYLAVYNEDPKPFVWTKRADQILESLKTYCQDISDT